MAPIDIPPSRLDAAIRLLSAQSGASIGFRDARLSAQRVPAVRGRFTAGQALERLLLGTRLQARRVAPNTYLIEPAPKRAAQPRPLAPRARRNLHPPSSPPTRSWSQAPSATFRSASIPGASR
ncbi:STN domain-containing protein [Sphingomonas hengshuiensis]|uniref:STN domain-containing protein n=1 Tax=Sphingomonas hengshuiensis TaxID=1609977 RepID=UPI000B1BE978|nr:STN domain-containing protein [Sphingomonas hengshuiensis]